MEDSTGARQENPLDLAKRFLSDAEKAGASATGLARFRRLFTAKDASLYDVTDGVVLTVDWFNIVPDGSIEIDVDAPMDACAQNIHAADAYAEHYSEVPGLDKLKNYDWIGGLLLNTKLGDLTDAAFEIFLAKINAR